jgi:hypothetical protein
MELDQPSESVATIEGRIVGEDQLLHNPLDLSIAREVFSQSFLPTLQRAHVYANAKAVWITTDRQIQRCTDCGSSSCNKCGGRPEHSLQPIDIVAHPRLSASAFAKELKSALPMCISFANVTEKLLDNLRDSAGVSIIEKRWKAWRAAVLGVAKYELRFVEPKRQEIWSALYQSPTATLELLLHPQQPEWRLYAKAEEKEPANSDIRRVLESPVGRLSCVDGLLSGRWEFALPCPISIPITIQGNGEPVPAWEARLGLTTEEFRDRIVPSKLRITGSCRQHLRTGP